MSSTKKKKNPKKQKTKPLHIYLMKYQKSATWVWELGFYFGFKLVRVLVDRCCKFLLRWWLIFDRRNVFD